jgi:hypothetical protein
MLWLEMPGGGMGITRVVEADETLEAGEALSALAQAPLLIVYNPRFGL